MSYLKGGVLLGPFRFDPETTFGSTLSMFNLAATIYLAANHEPARALVSGAIGLALGAATIFRMNHPRPH